MSGWVLLVRELYERGPLRAKDFETLRYRDCMLGVHTYLERCAVLGLVERPGRHGSDGARPYVLTPLGVDVAEGRVRFVVPPFKRAGERGGRPKGTKMVARPTWLSSLPRANEVRTAAG